VVEVAPIRRVDGPGSGVVSIVNTKDSCNPVSATLFNAPWVYPAVYSVLPAVTARDPQPEMFPRTLERWIETSPLRFQDGELTEKPFEYYCYWTKIRNMLPKERVAYMLCY